MLDPAFVRDHTDEVKEALRRRGLDPDKALGEIPTLEMIRRRLIGEVEALKRQQNTAGDEIAKARRQGKDTAAIQEASRTRAQHIKQLDLQLDSIEQRAQGPVTRIHLDCQHSPATELPDRTAEAVASFTSALPPSGT